MAWIRQGTEIVNTENDVWLEHSMSPPYSDVIWRIDSLHNDGFPYHLLLPDIPELNDSPNIYVGANKIKSVYCGSIKIKSIYCGSNKIY